MSQAFPRRVLTEAVDWLPEVDLVDTDGEFVLTAEMPGMSKEDIEIDVEDGVLPLSGEKKETEKHEWKAGREARPSAEAGWTSSTKQGTATPPVLEPSALGPQRAQLAGPIVPQPWGSVK